MPTRNVNLTDDLDRFVETRVSSGRFSNASEVVREGLRLLQRRENEERAKLELLSSAAIEGADDIDRGDYDALDSMEEIDAFMREVRAEAATGG